MPPKKEKQTARPPPPSAVKEAEISEGFQRASKENRRGSYGKAVKIIKQLRVRCGSYAPSAHLLLRAEATVLSDAADGIDKVETKRQYRRAAVEAAQRLVEARPDAIDFCLLRAEVLWKHAADEALGFESLDDVVGECERGLEIQDPIVFTDSFEGREKVIADLRQKLLSMIEFCAGEEDGSAAAATMDAAEGLARFQAQAAAARTVLDNPPQPLPSLQQQQQLQQPSRYQRLLEKKLRSQKKNVQEKQPYEVLEELVIALWTQSLTSEQKKGFFEVKVEELRAHIASLKLHKALSDFVGKCLSEALSLPGAHTGDWRVWVCYNCDETFGDPESHWQHMVLAHEVPTPDCLPQDLKLSLPVEVEKDLATMLLNGNWKPFDVSVLRDMINKHLREHGTILTEINAISDVFCQTSGYKQIFPLSDDSGRVQLLEEIHEILQLLLDHNCLFQTHIDRILELAVKLVEDIPSGSEFMEKLAFNKSSPLCLPFQEASVLQEILDLLKALPDFDKLQVYINKNNSDADYFNSGLKGQEKYVLSCDSSSIIFDAELFRRDKFSNDADNDDIERVEVRDLFLWLQLGYLVEETMNILWNLRQRKEHNGIILLEYHSELLHTLKSSYARKCQLLSCEGTLYKTGSCADEDTHSKKDELIKVDSDIMWSIIEMRDLKPHLGNLSAFNHWDFIMPLMHSFLKARLNELREKDAIKKSAATGDAFLKELERDHLKTAADKGDYSCQTQGKTKDKRKNKHYRKPKDIEAPKAFGSRDQNPSYHAVIEKLDLILSNDISHVEYETLSLSGESLKHQEKELGQNVVLDGGEINLEETSKYQSNAEKAAKEESSGDKLKMAVETPGGNIRDISPSPSETSPHISKGESSNDSQTGLIHNVQPLPVQILFGSYRHIVPQCQDALADTELYSSSTSNQSGQTHAAHLSGETSIRQDECMIENPEDVTDGVLNGEEIVVGIGLINRVGENNCFLNVIIQLLWHLQLFRTEFLHSSSFHKCVGDPCVVCQLGNLFNDLSVASTVRQERQTVDATHLRQALSGFYSEKNFFQERKEDVASDLLQALLNCLHKSSGSASDEFSPLEESKCTCIAHTFFGINTIEEMECQFCQIAHSPATFTSFFKNIVTSQLQQIKKNNADMSFNELVKLELMYSWFCNVDGCGKKNSIQHKLLTLPRVFTLVLDWQNDDISKTLDSITTELDVGVIFDGIEHGTAYSLVTVVCFRGCHYVCFAFSQDHRRWFKYDDEDVEAVGDWDTMFTRWISERWLPSVLCYESSI